MTRRELAGLGAALLATGLRAAESDFPSRNIDFIITKAPGGGFDSLVRIVSTPEEETCQAVRTFLADDSHPAFGVAESHQIFSHQAKADRRTIVRGDFAGQQRGQPVTPEVVARRRPWTGLREQLIFFARQHLTQSIPIPEESGRYGVIQMEAVADTTGVPFGNVTIKVTG
jgi:hypothetical protein